MTIMIMVRINYNNNNIIIITIINMNNINNTYYVICFTCYSIINMKKVTLK